MSDPTIWNRTVPLIVDGEAVEASVPNAATQVLADRTAALKSILDALEAGEQLVLKNAPLAANVPEGSAVYMSATTLEHDLALAAWQTLISSGGRLIPADSAVYSGIVISKSSDRVGNILMSGMGVLSGTGQTNLFNGATPVAGNLYWLSMLQAGTVQSADPLMAVRMLRYMGDNVVQVFPPQHEPVTHTHRQYTLDSGDWLVAASFPAAIVPVGASYGYDLTSVLSLAQNLAESLLPSVGEPVFVNVDNTVLSLTPGIHIFEDTLLLDENGIWWLNATGPDGNIDMTVTSADAKGQSLLHAIRSGNLGITTTVSNGLVTVTLNDFTETTGVAGHVVVKSFVGQDAQRGPVVEKIQVGIGLVATSPEGNGQGTVTIQQAVFQNMRIAAQLMNLNNAVTDVDGVYVFTQFPTNRLSSAHCSAVLPDLSTAAYQLVVWAQFLSPGSAQAAPDVSLTLVPTPAAAGVTPVAAAALVFPAFPVTVSAGDIYLLETTVPVSLAGYSQGTALWQISADAPSAALRMVNTGIRLELVP